MGVRIRKPSSTSTCNAHGGPEKSDRGRPSPGPARELEARFRGGAYQRPPPPPREPPELKLAWRTQIRQDRQDGPWPGPGRARQGQARAARVGPGRAKQVQAGPSRARQGQAGPGRARQGQAGPGMMYGFLSTNVGFQANNFPTIAGAKVCWADTWLPGASRQWRGSGQCRAAQCQGGLVCASLAFNNLWNNDFNRLL